MHCIHDITGTIYDMSSTVCDITFTICVTSHNDCFYDITHSTFMTYPLYMASHTVLWQQNHCVLHSHYVWYHTHCICVITPNVSILSNPVYVWHHLHYMYEIICNTYDITSTLYDIAPLYLWHQVHYIWHHIHYIRPHIHCFCVITPTLSMISQPLYVRYHNQYTCDILSTIFMTSYPLCKTSKHCVLMTPHSAYVWHHLHDRWHHIHSITTDHSIYDVTSTSAWRHTHSIRHCTHCVLVITTPPLISHPLLYDITPTVYVTSCALFIRAHPLLISSNLCTYDSTKPIYETTSSKQGNIYTIYVTSQPLICIITPTVLTTSHPLFVWHHTWHMYSIFCTIEDITSTIYDIKPPFLWPHTHYIWHRIHAISVITSTVLMISHKLYGISSHI